MSVAPSRLASFAFPPAPPPPPQCPYWLRPHSTAWPDPERMKLLTHSTAGRGRRARKISARCSPKCFRQIMDCFKRSLPGPKKCIARSLPDSGVCLARKGASPGASLVACSMSKRVVGIAEHTRRLRARSRTKHASLSQQMRLTSGIFFQGRRMWPLARKDSPCHENRPLAPR